jgi:hypothetical protein
MRSEDSLLERLSERDRRDSEVTPGTLDGHFGSCINFREKHFVKPVTGPSTASSALPW